MPKITNLAKLKLAILQNSDYFEQNQGHFGFSPPKLLRNNHQTFGTLWMFTKIRCWINARNSRKSQIWQE